jgi:hypothetical protein
MENPWSLLPILGLTNLGRTLLGEKGTKSPVGLRWTWARFWTVNSGEPCSASLWPPPLFIPRSVTGASQRIRVGRPQSGRRSRAQWAVGPIGVEIYLTKLSYFNTTILFFPTHLNMHLMIITNYPLHVPDCLYRLSATQAVRLRPMCAPRALFLRHLFSFSSLAQVATVLGEHTT